MKWRNPFAFRPGPVTFWTTIIYLAVIIPLLYVHETVPPAPADHDLVHRGLNLTEAWLDLQTMTSAYHPYNSHENDDVRAFLMDRAEQVLQRNGVDYTTVTSGEGARRRSLESSADEVAGHVPKPVAKASAVTIFDDRISNVTYTFQATFGWAGQYFEGNNFYVYVRGKEDPPGDWWLSEEGLRASRRTGGVLVNCHFDSVSTGYGATDDGTACVSMLQLLSHFTSEGRQPKNGIILLFNNGEEDGLLGAHAFGYSPLLDFCHTFVNLEGAAAGGRAMLFRTTDLQTAEAYARSPHPFGSVVAANAFERGVIKSGTDYEIFADVFGQRGMDIAFYEPRSRYHTAEDDARHTSVDSIWHMLSAALASTETLSETTSVKFNGPRSDGRKDLVQNGKSTEGVWFDWFGSAWTAFPLRGLFAWSLTLLVATPLVLLLVTYLLVRKDKCYYFARDIRMYSELIDDPIVLGGWRGFFRFPLALLFSAALTVASVYLLAKINPLIVYSSGYAVWAMTMSLFYFTFWLIMRGSSFVRPSALHRGFAMIWLFIIVWIIQVLAAVAEDRMHVGALYFAAFLHTAVFVSMLISLLEQFALPGKHEFARQLHDAPQERDALSRSGDDAMPAEETAGQANGGDEDGNDAEAPTETTPLRAGEQGYGSSPQTTTFANTYRRSVVSESAAAPAPGTGRHPPYEHEQSWSGRLPTWTWFIQLLLLAPVHVIILGNLSLVERTAMSMTGVDGSSLLTPLMGIGVLSMLLLLPLSPFIHRVTHHIPVFLLLVFIGTLIYNLTAFPFSANSRFKFKFQQTVDLDSGTNVVVLAGLEEFVRPVIASIPTAAGQEIKCRSSTVRGLTDCQYDASSLPPNPADGKALESLVSVEATKSADGRSAKVQVGALNTRMCFLDISNAVFGFSVQGGGAMDRRFGAPPRDGFRHVQLWRRAWDGNWTVNLQLADNGHSRTSEEASGALGKADKVDDVGDSELKVQRIGAESSTAASGQPGPLQVSVRCVWDDANRAAKVPALHEVMKFMPQWAIVTKKTIGLVQVKKTYDVASP